MDDSLCEEAEFGPGGDDDLFSLFDSFDGIPEFSPFTPLLVTHKSTDSWEPEHEPEFLPKSKKPKLASSEETNPEGQQRTSHITVERNRRKQMNEHISVLRSLMPCFYVKRGDQASIIGGVVDYINELQQLVQSLEAKKQRKVLSPRVVSSPLSPRTPLAQPGSPYKPTMPTASLEPSPTSSTSSVDNINELLAKAKSPVAEVEVKFSGPNLILKTASPPIPGQALKIISTLEGLSLEILNVNINTIDDTMLNSFTIKIGIECQLSAEELAHQIQQTFS